MLVFSGSELNPLGYTDSDFMSDKDARKSTSGAVYTFAGGAIFWRSVKQSCIADSTMEVEHVAAVRQLRNQLGLRISTQSWEKF